ncbi:MAG: discoidin domain-containing protein [Pirellulales bacterium]|nr:discoidin domain-containing protein [Pirellulales bacterium]
MSKILRRSFGLWVGFVGMVLDCTVLAEEPFDYFQNNWNVIGLKDYERGTRVTPDNRLELKDKAMVAIRVGKSLAPLTRRRGKTLQDGWIPIILIRAEDGPVRYDITLWATPLPTVKDCQKAFDWPTEGENYLNWIGVKVTNQGPTPTEAKVKIESAARSDANGAFEWSLAPNAKVDAIMRIPFSPVEDPSLFAEADPIEWLGRTVGYWHGVLDGMCHIEVPCQKATEALLAAHVCQLIANDLGEVHGGEGFYDQFYIRDGAYQVLELEEAGLADASRKAVDLYLQRQRSDGRFESQQGQFDANGQALWVLWQYYKMSADRHWLASVYPQMRRAVDWTMKARRHAPANSPFAGVLPNALADGEYLWDGKYHIVGYDFWNLRGILCTADAARFLGKEDEAEELRQEAKLYRAAIDAAWKRTGLAYFPPSWEKAGTHWGNTETLWPTELFDRDDPRVVALINHVREEFHGGFIEGTIQWHGHQAAIHPYMGAYTTMADLVLGNHEAVVRDFYWYLLHSTAAHAFPEGIYPEKHEAWNDTIPHGTGACNYAIMLRHMLVHEEGNELHLLKAVPDWWLGEGKEIRIEHAPTYFGEMTLVVQGTADGVRVDIKPPQRNPAKRIVLHLPESRHMVHSPENVEVAKRSNQKERWDFPAVLALYQKPDSPSLTTGKPATCSTAIPGYPSRLANDGYAKYTHSYWAMDVCGGDPAWWQVDLEEPTTVGRVVVVGFFGDERSYGFTVETSLDGKTWKMVADQRGNKELSTAKGYTCRFKPHAIRYLRVTQTANSANTGRHLVEVMAFTQ